MPRIVLLSLALAIAAPLAAQDGTATAGPHHALAAALTTDDYIEQNYAHAIEAVFESALRADPELAATEDACPGLFAAMLAAGEPIMRPAYRRDFLAYRVKLGELFGRELSAEHAREGATFFSSDLGRKFLVSLAANQSVDAQVGSLIASDSTTFSAETVAADKEMTARAGLAALEPLDRREVERILGGAAWAQEFARLRPAISEYQLEMANADYLPQEDAAMDVAFEAAADTHLTACYGED